GWHVNSHAPGDETLVPTRLAIEPPRGFELLQVRYPEATELPAGEVAGPVSVYQAEVTFEADLRAPTIAPASPLAAALHYQPCTESECLPPARTSVSFTITVA